MDGELMADRVDGRGLSIPVILPGTPLLVLVRATNFQVVDHLHWNFKYPINCMVNRRVLELSEAIYLISTHT